MEMNSGKALDEVCNRFHEAYRDEVLYTSRSDHSQFAHGRAGEALMKTGRTGSNHRRYTRYE